MAPVLYSVIASLPDAATRDAYIAWLKDGHVDQVIDAGAAHGLICVLDDAPGVEGNVRVMTQYVFPTREAFRDYEQHHAPRLRADGLARFGPDRGVIMERMLGEIA